MGRLTIYREVTVGNPTVVAVCSEVEYHGGWMEEEYVTVKVQSPTPVAFAIDDYVTYRGQRYSISYDPQKLKKASSGSHGEGFTYDGLKLYSDGSRLKDVAMKDIVLNDNQLSYTSLGKFSFYCQSVEDLADRIQANLNRDSSDWRVLTPNWNRTNVRLEFTMQDSTERENLWREYYDGSESAGKSEINISIDDNSCWDALKCAYNDFGLSYRIVGKTVVIGGKPIAASHVFMYGKNNGLREISDSGTDDQRIITKLFAYGSEKNLPLNYYGNTLVICNAPILQKTQSSPVSGTSFFHYIVDVKYDKKLFTRSIGADNYQLTLKKESGDSPHTTRFAFAGKPSSVVWSDEVMQQYGSKVEITVPENSIVPEKYIGGNFEIVGGLNKNLWPQTLCNKTDANYPGALSVNRLMLPGFPQQSVKDYFTATANWSKYYEKDFYPHLLEVVSRIHQEYGTLQWGNIYLSEDAYDPYITSGKCLTIGAREGTVNFDGNGNTQEILPSIAGGTDNVVLVGSSIEDNGYVQEADDFDIWIKDAAIAWDELYGAATETVVLSMTSGYCTGRDFEVSGVERAEKNGVSCWKFTLKRSPDSSMNRLFPYADSVVSGYCQIIANDTFVVTGIELPDEYVEEASVRLFIAAVDALDELSEPKRSYSPKIDQIFMQRDLDENGQSAMYYKLYPGIGLSIRDTDLAIDKTVYIDTLTIKEFGDADIATYDVTLRDEKELGLMEQIQVSVGGGVQTRGGSATAANEAHTASESVRSKSADRLSGNEAHNAWGQTYWENGKPQDVSGSLEGVDDITMTGDLNLGNTGMGIDQSGDAVLNSVTIAETTTTTSGGTETTTEDKAVLTEDGLVVTEKVDNTVTKSTVVDENGMTIGTYADGLFGTGGVFKMINDKSYLEADKLYVRMKAYFDTLEIRRYIHSGGNRVASAAGCRVTRVVQENPNGSFYCYFKANDGDDKVTNDFVAGDLAYCHTTNLEGESPNAELNQQDYWRLVMETGSVNAAGDIIVTNGATVGNPTDTTATEHYIKLANTTQPAGIPGGSYQGMMSGSTAPKEEDDIVQLGNVNDPTRQGAIVEAVSGAGCAPTYRIYQGLGADSSNLYTFTSPKVDMGYDMWNAKAYLNVFGNFYVGEDGNNPNTYVRYTQGVQPLLEIKAKIDATSGSPILDTIGEKNAVYTIGYNAMSASSGPDYKEGDVWILPTAMAIGTTIYEKGTIFQAVSERSSNSGTFDISHWSEKMRFTDDSKFNGYINQVLNGTGATGGSQTVANAIRTIKGALNEATVIDGGLVLTSLINLRSNNKTWAGISGQYDNSATPVKGNGIAAWFGGAMVDHEVNQLATDYAKSLFRFDGSGYLAGGNISWENDGDTTVQGTIKADNFFHAVCHYLEYGLSGIYYGSVLYYYKRESGHDETYDGFDDGKYYTAEQIYSVFGSIPPGFIITTGKADIVMCAPDPNNNWATIDGQLPYVTIPKPEDFQGKVIEVGGFCYGTGASGEPTVKTFEVHCVCGDLNPRDTRMTLLVWLNDSQNGLTTTSLSNKVTISTGGVARFLSVQLADLRWVWVLLANQTGGSVVINGGGGSGTSGVTSVGMTVPAGFSVSPQTITDTGSFDISFARGSLSNGLVLATPSSGNNAPSWRALVAADIPNLDWSKITSGTPTNLSGYGITDAKIENGEITLGNQTITPLTQHQSLADYLTRQEALDTFVLTSALAGYVTTDTEQTISGLKTFSSNVQLGAGTAVKAYDKGTDLLAYKSGTWGGVTGEHWFVGADGVDGFIRSASPLKRWANNSDQYTIWDASNFTPSALKVKDVEVVDDNSLVLNGEDVIYDAELASNGMLTLKSTRLSIAVPEYTSDLVNDRGFIDQTTADGRYLQLSGGTLKGQLTFADSIGNSYGAIRAEKIGNDEYLYLWGNDGVLINGLSVRKDNVIVQIEDVFLNLTGGMMEPGATITLQEIVNNIPVQTLVASQRWVNAQGYITQTTADGRYIKGVSVYGSSLTPDANRVVNIPYADINTPGVIQIGSGLLNSEGHTEVDTSVIASRSWANGQFVTALGVSGDNITYTKNGAATNLTVPFATRTMGFKGFGVTDSQIDANTMTVGGVKYALLANYTSTDLWSNTPSGMSYGNVLQLESPKSLDGQLAWDSNHGVTTGVTRKLYWRSRNSRGWGTNGWHTIAFEDWVTTQLNTLGDNLQSYVTTQLGGYLPLTGGSLSNDLTIASNKYLRFGSNSGGLLIHNTTNGNNSLDISANRINLNVENGLFCNGVEVPTSAGVSSIVTSICGHLYSAIQDEFVAKAGSSMTGALSMGNGINVNFGDCSITSNGSAQGNIQAGKILKMMGNYVAVTAGDNADANFTVNGNIVATRPWVTTQLGGYLPLTAGSSHPLTGNISYKGTKATYDMITFIDNVSDTYGNGIAIGGGGATIIGGGESVSVMASQLTSGGNEVMYIGNDQGVIIYTNLQNGLSDGKKFDFTTGGNLFLPKRSDNGCLWLSSIGAMNFNAGTGGWATQFMALNNSTAANLGGCGMLGENNSLTYFYIGQAHNNTWVVVKPSGNVGIGTTNPQAKLDVNGNVRISGTLTGVTNIDGLMIFDSTNNKVTVGTLDVTTLGMTSISVGESGYKMSISSNDNAVTFDVEDVGDYVFAYGNSRGNIYAGDGDFTGNVGIGTAATSSYKLKVQGASLLNGLVGIGTTPVQGHALDVDGDVYVSGSVIANNVPSGSDIRMKNVRRYLEPSVRDVAFAPIIEFDWKDGFGGQNASHSVGSIAQYWQTVFPQAVREGKDGMLCLEYGAVALASAITAARKAVDNERRIAELELRVAELEDELAAMVSQQSETTEN